MSVLLNGIEAIPVFGGAGAVSAGKVFAATATTNANGQWSLTVPAGVFAFSPAVHATPVSADNTAPNAAYASVVAPVGSGGAWTLSGLVLLPAAVQAFGGCPPRPPARASS